MNVTEFISPNAAANLILAGLALLLLAIGALGWWVAGHPARAQAFLYRLRHHPRVRRAEERYREQIEFLVRRFQPEGAFGLSFTIGLAAVAISVWIFGSVLQDVLAHEEVALFDGPIVSFIATHRLGWVTEAMEGVTYIGSGLFLTAMTGAAGLMLRYRTGSWRPFLLLTVAVLGAMLLDLVTRFAVARPRPPAVWMAMPVTGFGFPSGHSTESTAACGAIAYLIAQTQKEWPAKVASLTIGALIAFLVGVSRVYLGVHWPTDVIAGWALGCAWLAIVFTTSSTIEKASVGALAEQHLESSLAAQLREPVTQLRARERQRPHVTPEGLTGAEVQGRIKRGEVNSLGERTSRSVGEILRANIVTRFNGLLGSLFVIMLWVGPPQDALFGVILGLNTFIGIVQEVRAKRTLDRLVLLAGRTAHVVRDGVPRPVRVDQIVLDDVIDLRAGDQVPVDGLALSANGLEIDESLLTGESEPVAKQRGDEVLSGSLVVAGSARVQAVRVAGDSYARGLAAEARRFAIARSEIRDGIDRILAYVTWLLVPTAVLLLVTQILETEAGWRDAVATSVGAVVGMVPEGLILLTTIALATAIVRLGRRHVLVQELPAVEMLARADVVCFDKTGTLTDGHIQFERLVPAADLPRPIAEDVHRALGSLAGLELHPNASVRAIAQAIRFADAQWKPTVSVPFSPARKWSAATFQDHGSWILGAPEILLRSQDGRHALAVEAEHIASAGRRVLALAYSSQTLASTSEPALPDDIKPVALVVLAERIRGDAVATLRYLTEQGVSLKVLSGDNPRTVATIAAAAGVPGAKAGLSRAEVSDTPDLIMDATERMTVFGRLSPHQKRDMVAALRRRGHTVAMLGDGINDALALKEADIGIAMGSGTAATRAVAQVVLLSDEFAALPSIIAEGRRVVANVERTANLFLAKTSYVLLMALAIGEAGVEYPFLPRHLSLIGCLTIGIPAFFLALAPNAAPARSGFVLRVLRFSVPAGFIAAGATLATYAATRALYPQDLDMARTAATLTLAAAGWSIVLFLGRARTFSQRLLLTVLAATLGLILIVSPVRTFFALQSLPPTAWLPIAAVATATHFVLRRLSRRSPVSS